MKQTRGGQRASTGRHQAARLARLAGCAGVLSLAATLAMGQGAAVDVNAPQPGSGRATPPQPAVDKPVDKPEAPAGAEAIGVRQRGQQAPVEAAQERNWYPISRFLLEYRSEHPQHPPIEELLDAPVTLGVAPEGLTAPREGLSTTTLRLADLAEGAPQKFSDLGLVAVGRALVEEMNRRGIIGVFIQLNPEDVDEATMADKRPAGQETLRLIIWTGRVAQVRTIASGERLMARVPGEDRSEIRGGTVDNPDPVHERIRRQSPVQQGELLNKDLIDAFVFRLNRHPSRRVDVALAPGDDPEQSVLDYLVSENKPWSIYAGVSNTGTESTSLWRQRFGFQHTQLTGHDDILQFDYVTGDFDKAHALTGSYDFPLISDRLRMRVNALYTQFDASEVGLSNETFSGQSYGLGAEVSWTAFQSRESFVDLFAGARFLNTTIENTLLDSEGEANLLFPYVGARFDRVTESMATFASATIETQPDLFSVDNDDLQNLGRLQVDGTWTTLKWDLGHSMYIEPLINRAGFRGEANAQGPTTLAHEILIQGRGQFAFDRRLIAGEQEVAGGMFSVRGYSESIAAGDTVAIATAEYRLHVPRLFPVSEPGRVGNRRVGLFGDTFRWAPQTDFGRADWDWVLKAFFDVGRTMNSEKLIGETDQTLMGAGFGTEISVKRNFTLRMDVGFALKDVEEPGSPTPIAESGDIRGHFSVLLLY